LVFAEPSPLDNPELTFNLSLRQPSDKCPYRVEQVVWRWPGRKTQYRNASVIGGSEEQWVPEVEIEGDNAPVLGRAGHDQFRICRTTEALLWHSSHFMSRLA
jgi:hypothetical protein